MSEEGEKVTDEQISNIPQKLKDMPRWVGFMLLWNEKKQKNDKVPINPHSFWGASSTNPQTWAAFPDALAAIGQPAQCHRKMDGQDRVVKGTVDGVGFVLGDGICGFDLDHCIDSEGQLTDLAADVVGTVDSYTEYSPSGTGLHVLFSGSIPPGRNKSKDGSLEAYCTGRFFTVTGDGSGELNERTEWAAEVFRKYMMPDSPRPVIPRAEAHDFPLSEWGDGLPDRMFQAKNGAAIRRLWDGDTSAYGNDDSRADSAMVMHIAFYTKDEQRIDELFRQCALMRPKWDEKHGAQTYGQLTIGKALAAQHDSAVTRAFGSMHTDYAIHTDWTPDDKHNPPQDGVIVIDPLQDERKYGWNDIGTGALFADTYRNVARYVPQAESWYAYAGGVWKLDSGSLRVAEMAKSVVQYMIGCAANISDDDKREKYLKFVTKMNSNRARMAMLESAKSIYPIQLSEFDKDPYLFNCQNGTFDLRTFKLRPHSPADFLSKIANVDYLPGVTCERWKQFIGEIMEHDAEKAQYLQTAIGYAVAGLQNQKCFFILHGQKTNNGKSTFMDAIMHIMGDYAKAAQADVITSKQFAKDSSAPSEDVARLWGARLVSMAEPDKSARLNVGLIKQMTGNDPLTARFLRQNSFQFVPEFKIFLHANDLPQTTDDTIFSSGRVKVIQFNREFKPEEQDRTLAAAFREPENASGILNWMLEGARLFLCSGLRDPVAIQAAVAAYRAESDVVGDFVSTCIQPKPGISTPVAKVYDKYRSWCYQCGYQAMGLKNLTRELRKKLEIRHGKVGNVIDEYIVLDPAYVMYGDRQNVTCGDGNSYR